MSQSEVADRYHRIGMLPAWTISTAPNAALVNEMLDKAIATLSKEEYSLIHSDRGCHYRWHRRGSQRYGAKYPNVLWDA